MEESHVHSTDPVPDVPLDQLTVFDRPDVRIDEFTTFETPSPEVPTMARKKGPVHEWIESLAFTIVFVLVFTNYIAQATQVPTESMKPAIMVGDHFFLDKIVFPANFPEAIRPYLPKRSLARLDVIAFRSPTDGNVPFVKRVIGTPGDVVEVRNKNAYINGKKLDEPYKIHVDTTVYGNETWMPEELKIRDNFGPVTIPPDSYFVMGDNRDNSNDSRYWGFITSNDVIGKPLFVYWSYESDPYLPGERTIRERLADYLSIASHFFTKTRWFRMGTFIK